MTEPQIKTLTIRGGKPREIAFDFSGATKVLLNGYQAWTNTWELAPRARQRGLRRVPAPVVAMWSLDGGGDYRFYQYSGKAGRLHGWTYAYVLDGEGCYMVASLDESQGFTLIEFDTKAGTITVTPEAQTPVALIRAATVEEAFDAWLQRAHVSALPAKPLVGYTSWYRHYGNISSSVLKADLAGCVDAMRRLDTDGCLRLFQIDDGWATVGDWLTPREDRFPEGMAALAAQIAKAGFVPGLWVSPFVCERDSALFREHRDWLLRDEDGRLVSTGCQWTGGLALDTTKPEVRTYVRQVLHTLTAEWGFKLLKLDFLYAACMLPHDGKTRGALMADAVELIRGAVAPGTLLLGCGVPLGSALGKFEYCRVSCDVGPDWDDKLFMRALHQERISTKNAIATTRGRRMLDGRAFRADGDAVILRADATLTEDQKAQMLRTAAECGGVLLTSDNMGDWTPAQLEAFQAAVDTLRR